MSEINDGGRAFPQHVINPKEETYSVAANAGMSLRDYFAAKAMQAIIAKLPLMSAGSDPAFGLGDSSNIASAYS